MASTDAMDITNAETQEALQNSLLGDSLDETAQYESYPVDTGEGYEQAETTDSAFDEINQELAEQTQEILDESEQSLEEDAAQEQEQQPVEITPQTIAQSMEQLDSFLEEKQLVDPAESAVFAANLGLDAENSAPGQIAARTAVQALAAWEQSGGDPANLGPLHPLSATNFHDDICANILNIDPRLSPIADPVQFATDMRSFAVNFIATVNEFGVGAAVEQINSPAMAQAFADCWLFHCGAQTGADREAALHFADSFAKPMLAVLRKLDAQRAEEPAPRRRSAPASRGRNTRGFQSNSDLFDDEAMELYHREHGNL